MFTICQSSIVRFAILLSLCSAALSQSLAPSPTDTRTFTVTTQALIKDKDMALQDLIRGSYTDLNKFWGEYFRMENKTFRMIGLPKSSKEEPTDQCGPNDTNNAFYCAASNKVNYGVKFINDIYKDKRNRGYAVMVLFAHEWAHGAQHQLNIRPPKDAIGNRKYELQADCLAGAFTKWEHRDRRVILDPGDADEGAGMFYNIGDDQRTTAWYNIDRHGAPIDRLMAFIEGYENGAKYCLDENWAPTTSGLMNKIEILKVDTTDLATSRKIKVHVRYKYDGNLGPDLRLGGGAYKTSDNREFRYTNYIGTGEPVKKGEIRSIITLERKIADVATSEYIKICMFRPNQQYDSILCSKRYNFEIRWPRELVNR